MLPARFRFQYGPANRFCITPEQNLHILPCSVMGLRRCSSSHATVHTEKERTKFIATARSSFSSCKRIWLLLVAAIVATTTILAASAGVAHAIDGKSMPPADMAALAQAVEECSYTGPTYDGYTCSPSGYYSISFSKTGDLSCQYNATIDWGDGTTTPVIDFQNGQLVEHTFSSPDTYIVEVTGSGSRVDCVFHPATYVVEVPAPSNAEACEESQALARNLKLDALLDLWDSSTSQGAAMRLCHGGDLTSFLYSVDSPTIDETGALVFLLPGPRLWKGLFDGAVKGVGLFSETLFVRRAAVEVAEGATNLLTKESARTVVSSLGLPEAQAAAAARAISRATTASSIDVVTQTSGSVIVRITRTGRNGYQVIETTIAPDGLKRVVQMAFDATGKLVHYDPKGPF